ncbi:MAG: YggS family pyridoxal phosphate-dependent enzyme [Phycisphaerales bacterium]|nr:YggS family pyridoxal phosphate-dependent enzyme [Phycisphaerales bacterium]
MLKIMSPNPVTSAGQLRDAYRKTTERVAEAALRSGRRPSDILMVAVSKYASPDQIRLLWELGQMDFAENRAQQLAQRAALMEEFVARRRWLGPAMNEVLDTPVAKVTAKPRPNSTSTPEAASTPAAPWSKGIRWHMIGRLQRNKIKTVVPLVRLVHSVDSLRLAEDLHAFGGRQDMVIDVLLQVNASGEESKAGVVPAAVHHLAEQINSMVHLRLRGLMTMAPHSDDPQDSRPTFARTAELFQELRTSRVGGSTVNILSMGMSTDFTVAIEEGANLVRLGSVLFGTPTGLQDHDEDDQPRGVMEDEPIDAMDE